MSDWLPVFTTGTPSFSFNAMMAYDKARERLVLYGGGTGGGGPGTDLRTWELYGAVWNPVTTASAPTTFGGTNAPWNGWMVYDESREVCVLFFYSNDGAGTCETWEYDGSDWTQFGGSTPARSNSAATYDPVREQVVMWGGGSWSPGALDTTYYTYEGTAWSSHTTAHAPVRRDQVAIVYDRDANNILMFGGYTGVTPPSSALRPNDTWTLDLSGTPDWTERFPSVIPYFNNGTDEAGEDQNKMAFSETLGKVVLCQPSGPSSTWLWDGFDWEEVSPAVFPTENAGQVAWDGEYQRIIYYGGSDSTDSLLFPAEAPPEPPNPAYQRIYGWRASIDDNALETVDVLVSPQGGTE